MDVQVLDYDLVAANAEWSRNAPTSAGRTGASNDRQRVSAEHPRGRGGVP
jgi:hypothetical protein